MNEWNNIRRLRESSNNSFESDLLNSARFDAPRMGARHRVLHVLGLVSGTVAIPRLGEAASESVAPASSASAAGSGAGLTSSVAPAASVAPVAVGGAGLAGVAATLSTLVPSAAPAVLSTVGAAGSGQAAALAAGTGALELGGLAAAGGALAAGAPSVFTTAGAGAAGLSAGIGSGAAFGSAAGSAGLAAGSATSAATGTASWLGTGLVAKWIGVGLAAGGLISATLVGVSGSGTKSDQRSVANLGVNMSAPAAVGRVGQNERVGQTNSALLGSDDEAQAMAQAVTDESRATHLPHKHRAKARAVGSAQGKRMKQRAAAQAELGSKTSESASRKTSAAQRRAAKYARVETGVTGEVVLIDRARAALRRGDVTAALSELTQHGQRFEHGVLKPEVEILRIEALLLTGERSDASRKARAFLRAYPTSPHRDRVLGLLADAGG